MNFITRNVSNLKLMNFGSSFPFDWLRPSSKMLQPEISLFRTFHWGWPRREKAPRNFQEISIMFLSFLSFAFEFAFVAKVFLLTEAVHKHTHTHNVSFMLSFAQHIHNEKGASVAFENSWHGKWIQAAASCFYFRIFLRSGELEFADGKNCFYSDENSLFSFPPAPLSSLLFHALWSSSNGNNELMISLLPLSLSLSPFLRNKQTVSLRGSFFPSAKKLRNSARSCLFRMCHEHIIAQNYEVKGALKTSLHHDAPLHYDLHWGRN